MMTWHQCRDYCASLNSNMLCIETQEENDAVASVAMARHANIFVDYTDEEEEGVWRWSGTCPSTYSNWYRPW
jgi:hypothetical protein